MHYGDVLADLREQRSKLDAAIVALEALASDGVKAPKGERKSPRVATAKTPQGVEARAKALKVEGHTAGEIGKVLKLSSAKVYALTAGIKRGPRSNGDAAPAVTAPAKRAWV
jgi:hypothetical protein